MIIKKRTDSKYCYDVNAYNRIFPYLLKRRCDSTVYYDVELDLTEALKFVRKWNKEHPDFKIRLFSLILVAMIRTIAVRPKVNRFVAANEVWQRDELSISFVVKKDMSDDSPETSTPLYFKETESFETMIKRVEDYIANSQQDAGDVGNKTELTINRLFKFLPSSLITLLVKMIGRMDQKGHGAPKWVRDADGLHVSMFVASIGSVGMKNAHIHHHLYEWGTTSMFCVLEELHRIKDTETDGYKDIMNCAFSVDERVCDGFYYIKTINMCRELLKEPEKLLTPLTDEDIPHLMTKEEHKAYLKSLKNPVKQIKSDL